MRTSLLLTNYLNHPPNLISSIHTQSRIIHKITIKSIQIQQSLLHQMLIKKLSILTLTIQWQLLQPHLPLNYQRLLIIQHSISIHIEITTLQTMYPLSNLSTRNYLTLTLIQQKLIKHPLKFLYQPNLLKIPPQLIHTHHRHRHHLLTLLPLRRHSTILIIFIIRHLIKPRKKISQFIWNMIITKNKDLIMIPHIVQHRHKTMRILSYLI